MCTSIRIICIIMITCQSLVYQLYSCENYFLLNFCGYECLYDSKFGINVHAMGKILFSEMRIFPILLPLEGNQYVLGGFIYDSHKLKVWD